MVNLIDRLPAVQTFVNDLISLLFRDNIKVES